MRGFLTAKGYVVTLLFIALIGGVGLFALNYFSSQEEVVVEAPEEPARSQSVLGASVEGRAIESYTFGDGPTDLLFVGGVHGGYEWNSTLLAYEFIDYFTENPEEVPENTTLHIIPSANPDGLFAVTQKEGRFTSADVTVDITDGTGRFNANGVDLNRNFDCKWAPESTWRGQTVSAGTEVFSEPEARVLRDYVINIMPDAAVFWHSVANNVYASECEGGILPDTLTIMDLYARAGGYGAIEKFDAYPITGDVEGWLASINIPAITVELETRNTTEWSRNLSGVKALLNYYAN